MLFRSVILSVHHTLGEFESFLEESNHASCDVLRVVNAWVMSAFKFEITTFEHHRHTFYFRLRFIDLWRVCPINSCEALTLILLYLTFSFTLRLLLLLFKIRHCHIVRYLFFIDLRLFFFRVLNSFFFSTLNSFRVFELLYFYVTLTHIKVSWEHLLDIDPTLHVWWQFEFFVLRFFF